MSEIIYPQGCRSVTEDLGPDELIRRLKVQSDGISSETNNALHTKYNFKTVFFLFDRYILGIISSLLFIKY